MLKIVKKNNEINKKSYANRNAEAVNFLSFINLALTIDRVINHNDKNTTHFLKHKTLIIILINM